MFFIFYIKTNGTSPVPPMMPKWIDQPLTREWRNSAFIKIKTLSNDRYNSPFSHRSDIRLFARFVSYILRLKLGYRFSFFLCFSIRNSNWLRQQDPGICIWRFFRKNPVWQCNDFQILVAIIFYGMHDPFIDLYQHCSGPCKFLFRNFIWIFFCPGQRPYIWIGDD